MWVGRVNPSVSENVIKYKVANECASLYFITFSDTNYLLVSAGHLCDLQASFQKSKICTD